MCNSKYFISLSSNLSKLIINYFIFYFKGIILVIKLQTIQKIIKILQELIKILDSKIYR